MNVQRVTAAIAIGGVLIGAASIALLAAGAAGLPLPEVPRAPIAAPTPTSKPADHATAGAAPADAASVPVDTGALDYNPYITPGDPDYIPLEVRAEYLGRETVISRCMAEHGFEYHVAAWWLDAKSQPRGLSYEESILWSDAYYGEANDDWGVQVTDWERMGCLGVGLHAEEVARAAGTPLSAPVPDPDPEAPTPREMQHEFQRAIQTCMAERGFEYRIPAVGEVGTSMEDNPAMPEGLNEEERAAWLDALWGNAGAGAAYRWEDAGCDGYAVHVTGNDNMH